MSKPNRAILIGAAVAVCAATAVTASPASAIGGCDGGAANPLAINGPNARTTTFGQTTPVTGTSAGGEIGVWYHKAFVDGYVQRDTVTAPPCEGSWGTSYVADDDYRIFASSGGSNTPSILVQIAPTI